MAFGSGVLRGGRVLLRVLIALNAATLVVFVAALILSWAIEPFLVGHLVRKYGASLRVGEAVEVLRLLLVLGIASALAVHPILSNLFRIVGTVAAGDPFVDGNATLLNRIGWALLMLQLLDLCLGALGRWIAMLKLQWTGWTPSIGGWLAVVMVFVLARVFRIGARMRDDLAATV